MIRYCVAQHDEQIFNSYILEGFERNKAECAISKMAGEEIRDFPHKNSIFVRYNECVKKMIDAGVLGQDDILCFVHEDVKLLDPNFVEKVELVFKEKQDIGLLGFVGTSELPTSLAWWQAPSEKLRGHVIQEIAGHEKHLVKGSIGYFDDLVAVDGLCFFMRSRIFTDHNFTFDEKNFFGYDFYDIDTCLSVLEMGFKIAVADILVLHKSIGDVSAKGSWKKNAMALEKKWIEKGYKLPFTQKTFINSEISEITEIRI